MDIRPMIQSSYNDVCNDGKSQQALLSGHLHWQDRKQTPFVRPPNMTPQREEPGILSCLHCASWQRQRTDLKMDVGNYITDCGEDTAEWGLVYDKMFRSC